MRIKYSLVALPATLCFTLTGAISAAPQASASASASTPSVKTASTASWSVSNCRLERTDGQSPTLHSTVTIKNLDPNNTHSFYVQVVWGTGSDRYGDSGSWYVGTVEPLATATDEPSDNNPSASVSSVPDGPVSCRIASVTDENGEPVQGE
ncbi:hypothetical protein AB0L14_06525 [Streptomyces sp. NPDC052727]|uniref:hypothetical protein n=1 Tax=Streptomyces sp. NPDC052727 TaxID=3154854 RepID=UPI00343F9468